MRRTMRGGALGAAAMFCAHLASAQLGVPLYGDVNLDGIVDNDDLTIVSTGLGRVHTDVCTTGDPLSVLDGDANHDGYVNTTDYLLVVSNLNESLGAIPAVAGVDIVSSYNPTTKKVTATDAYSGSGSPLLVDPSGPLAVWSELNAHQQDPVYSTLEPSVTLVQKDDGFDLVFFYDNTSGTEAMQPGRLNVPNLNFTNLVHVRKFLTDSQEYEFEAAGAENVTPITQWYPDDKYSPIEVIRGDIDASGSPEYTVGVSLLYPVLEYKHGVRMSTIRVDERWHVRFDLNPWYTGPPNDPPVVDLAYSEEGNIQPGETREYRVVVRFMRASTWASTQPLGDQHENDWLRLLLDYRRHFRQMYGGVQYARDVRPMLALNIARFNEANCLADDYGFLDEYPMSTTWTATGLRPTNPAGWEGWVSVMEDREAEGYKRFMLRAPTGVFCSSGQNLPFQFTSNWWGIAGNDPNEPILDTLDQIEAFAKGDSTREVALWWGHAMRVEIGWPPASIDVLNPCDGGHVGLAMDEMDGALFVGASSIGLEAGNLRVWKKYSWVRTLIEEYPDVVFMSDPRQSDIMHTLGPSWIKAMPSALGSDVWVREPHTLADMLLPGHETHAGVDRVTPTYGNATTVQAKAADFAAWGYVPHFFVYPPNILTDTSYNAVESWWNTVPADILASE